MDIPIHTDTISMAFPFLYSKGSQVEFLNYDVYLTFIFANSADPDEMPHMQKYLFADIHNENGKVILSYTIEKPSAHK